MRRVAFIRNLNQGQRGHVSTTDLVAAFVEAGCRDPAPFQANGTVVFTGEPARADDALQLLAARTGVHREVYTRELDELYDIIAAHRDEPDAARRELTLHDGGTIEIDEVSRREAAHRRCRLLESGPGWVVTLNERDRESHATPVVERLTGRPATSRGLPTLSRVIARFLPDR